MRKGMMAAFALFVVVAVAWGAVKPSAQSKGGAAVAFAKANIAQSLVNGFGGKGTTFAQVSDVNVGQGEIELTFTGKYPKDITADTVIVNVTPEISVASCVANAFVNSASPTEIVIRVNVWRSDSLTPVAGGVFVTVYVGQTPF
jgi:hypothetical protein